ncbi:MAG: hypothetical protein WD669_10820 [Pirellulales bacterium]
MKYYQVRVGHWEIRLQAHNIDEAIELARRHLSAELPRLYDVIRALTATRFQVEAAA